MQDNEGSRTFPGFSTAFDLDAMAKLLEVELLGERVVKCEISDVKYRPGVKCVLLYKVKVGGAASAPEREAMVTAVLLKGNETHVRRSSKEVFLPTYKMVLLPFPEDHLLTWLPAMYHEDSVKKLLAKSRPKLPFIPRNVNISTLVYKPQMRATFDYEILAEDPATGNTGWQHVIAKTNAFRTAKRVFANYWALWKASKGEIPMPKPIAFLNEPQWTLQEKVVGTRLGAMVDTEHFADNIAETARMIARFHTLEIPLCNTRKLDQELRMINPRTDILIHLFPELGSRLGKLREAIIGNLERRMDIRAPIHADLHHTNLLVDGPRVTLIDVDEMAFGDPCVDIGRFLASLRIPSLRAFGSFDGLAPLRELFLETYLRRAPGNIPNIRLFEAASLLTSAASVFRLQRPDWKNEVLLLLDDAECTFVQAQERKTLSLAGPEDRYSRRLPMASKLEWALDKTYIQALLTPALSEKMGETLVFCKCLGHVKEKSAFLVSYKVITSKGKEKGERILELRLYKWGGGRAKYEELLATKKGGSEPLAYFTELGAVVVERPI